ncbi:MAG: hypothetical protein Kow00109_11730 [Acidobacteriota bacterium]
MTEIGSWLAEPGLWLILLAVAGVVETLFLATLVLRLSRTMGKQSVLFEAKLRRTLEWQWARTEAELKRWDESLAEHRDEMLRALAELELRHASGVPKPRPAEPGNRLEKRHKVRVLADAGMTPREIAQKLRLSLAETRLLMGLAQGEPGKDEREYASALL